jgi:hypothetical protein
MDTYEIPHCGRCGDQRVKPEIIDDFFDYLCFVCAREVKEHLISNRLSDET